MISIPELWAKFGPALDVPSLGKCLAIPGSEFDPDWEAQLDDQGFTVFFETWDNHPMTVIPLEKEQDNVEIKKVKNMVKAKLWSKIEDDLLVTLWNQEPQLSVSEIASQFKQKFPTRSASGVTNRIQQLQQKEKRIKSRFICKKPEASKEAKRSLEKKDDCSENISVLEEIPVESLPKIDGTDILLDLVKKYQMLSEGYQSLSKAYVDLRIQFENMQKAMMQLGMKVETTDAECRKHVTNLVTLVDRTSDLLIKHKHADKTGEATMSMGDFLQ